MANEGHIIIPLDLAIRLQGEKEEYDRTRKVWKRDSLYRQMAGRVLGIRNEPFTDGLHRRALNPIQAACLALDHARRGGFDVIRVETPGEESAVMRSRDFSVAYLAKLGLEDTGFFPAVEKGLVRMEDEATSEMPQEWKVDPANGLIAPLG